ncbi:Exonuclease [Venustampulla echinocandica]|uniref:Exonuclease n=1 Tax=Venustampulla echinocandica TaxID=2656787 RepID=A0A370TUG1_9HELO|nr:Exonuclease [Venustampulla echinocandica]RDL39173.1 Exonuclease [Venustampulla echinocandica]
MFSSKDRFSEIQCPYQETCVLPRCIFAHSKGLIDNQGTVIGIQSHAELDGHDLGGPRKRLKVDDGNKAPAMGQQKLSSVTRPVSPPPLRRKVENRHAAPTKQPLVKTSSNPASTPAKSSAGAKTPVKVVPKKEGLNPRPLKVPAPATHEMRFRLLRALHEQFNRLNSELVKDANKAEEPLVLSEQELITKALDAEQEATSNPIVYSNVVKNKILVFKRMSVKQWKEERELEVAKVTAAEAASRFNAPVSKPTGPPTPIETGLSLEEELELMPQLYAPVTGLSQHGYITSIPSDQEIDSAKKGIEAAKGWEICDRCKGRFQVFPGRREEDGALTSGGSCTYHYGKAFFQERSANDPKAKREKRYRCCGEAMGDSRGCTKADSHVFKVTEAKRLAAVLNFECTPENTEKESSNPVCIDGEMGYTVYGLDLIRLTATSYPSGDELFDVLVRPVGEILDLNSRYSGVWPKDMAEALPHSPSSQPSIVSTETSEKKSLRIVDSLAAARSLLMSHLSPSTPIIGHGLENDLNATRLVHPTIIDTALLFPHRAGLPYRNALKMLMQTHLNRNIQVVVDGKMEGHDSKEDANAAGMLVKWKIGQEWKRMKREGWVLEHGEFKPPKGIQGLGKFGGLGSGAGTKRSREGSPSEELVIGRLK